MFIAKAGGRVAESDPLVRVLCLIIYIGNGTIHGGFLLSTVFISKLGFTYDHQNASKKWDEELP